MQVFGERVASRPLRSAFDRTSMALSWDGHSFAEMVGPTGFEPVTKRL